MDEDQHRPTVDLRKGGAEPPTTSGGTWAPGPPPPLSASAGGPPPIGAAARADSAPPSWSGGGAPPPVPVGSPRPRRNVRMLATAGVLAVLVLATVIALVAVNGSGSKGRGASGDAATTEAASPSAAASTSAATDSTAGEATAPSDDGAGSATADESDPTAPASATPIATDPGQRYAGPGGISVTGPSGWVVDYSAHVSSVRDYIPPDSTDRRAGPSLRIGVGNLHASGSFSAEAGQAANFLRSKYDARIVGPAAFGTFLGTDCADIEYVYAVDDLGVVRHGIERLWRNGGVTMIIQSSGLADDWPATLARFRQLTASAEPS